jgi:hypothetical protein
VVRIFDISSILSDYVTRSLNLDIPEGNTVTRGLSMQMRGDTPSPF